MKGRTAFLRRGVVLAGVVAAVAAGGVAYAAIPDGGGVYTACMLKHVGTLRLIDPSLPSSNWMSHCTSLETQVSWNQTGQQGTQGPQGPQGPKGDTGPRGPAGADGSSHGYDATNTYTVNDMPRGVVGLTDLPAGSYAVSATGANRGPDDAQCQLDKNGFPLNEAVDYSSVGNGHATTLAAVFTTGGSDVVELTCYSPQGLSGTPDSKIDATITAIQLTAVN